MKYFPLIASVVLSITLLLISPVIAQNKICSGVVIDNSKNPIANATITIVGKNKGTISDSLGKFNLFLNIKDSITISAIGYYNLTILPVDISSKILITLNEKTNKVDNVVVESKFKNNKTQELNQTEKNIISHGLDDFKTSQNLSYGTTASSGISFSSGKPSAIHSVSNQPTGRLYNGSSIPVFVSKDETKGSRYLLPVWVKGSVTTKNGSVVINDESLYNYDKISKHLLQFKDDQNAIELDDNIISSFSLNIQDSTNLHFEKIPALNNGFLQVLVKSNLKYCIAKFIHTKFVKATYVSTGLTESGNNFDEYVDESIYYVYFPTSKSYKSVELRKKSIKQAFVDEKDKVNEYFSKSKDADIDEKFLKGLIEYLNN